MKRSVIVLLLVVCLIVVVADSAAARDPLKQGLRINRPDQPLPPEEYEDLLDPGLIGLNESAAVDTFCIVWYTFEQMAWQGWTRMDNTAQRGDFWRVDDFAGLGGGSHGGLVPIEGTKSMWCGVRSSTIDPYLCSWYDAPGYGNKWSQMLATGSFNFSGPITLSYQMHYDSEPDYDFTRVEYDAGGGDWRMVAEYTGAGDTVASHVIALTQARTKLRFHFISDGAWSDEDGLYNTDGGCIVDAIRVQDSGALNNYQDFESAAVGAKTAGIWTGKAEPGFGTYSGLKNNLTDKDPCNDNFATQIVFFIGSWCFWDPAGGLCDTPWCMGDGGLEAPCQNELVISPVIDMTKYSLNCNNVQNGTIPSGDLSQLGGCSLRFTVYRDLPLANLVFYEWKVRNVVDGCPGPWRNDNFMNWGTEQAYIFENKDISAYVGNGSIQVGLGVVDMCDDWYLVYGNCAAHTSSPWFDNVRLYRYRAVGPHWSYRDLDLFQDNFPEFEFILESYVRADAANDINAKDNPAIRPGDSIVVGCASSIGGGIAVDPVGGPAVYLHVKCAYIGPEPLKPALFGPALAGGYGSYKSDDGVWTIIQGDAARTGAGIVEDKYMFDLNDALFTRGYMIEYYFTARDVAGEESALPRWAGSSGPYFEFTCLPTKNSNVLFVDDFSGRGSFVGTAENYWMSAFYYSLFYVDKYDVNGPTSGASNGPGGRAKTKQLVDWYDIIVWDSGDLQQFTISDGTINSDKSNDCQMLIDWIEQSEHVCGLWICGDDVANDLYGLASTQALTLMSTWCGVDFVATSYYAVTGGLTGYGIVTPLVTGEADAGVFVHSGVPDKFYAYGGCPAVNKFDVLEKTVFGKYALSYPVHDAANRYAAIASSQMNPGGYYVRTMWFGFSFQYIRDDVNAAPIDRFELAKNVFQWMQETTHWSGVDDTTPAVNALTQNFPNPFNPSTTIKFDLEEKGPVTLKVYNVAGQLVRTLVDEARDAGAYSAVWDGRNNIGADASSGIYFYKMETAGFLATKKLVLLR
ncbi:MAG: FlgD immunoglobulin-like domain containing protein [Candidatus Krumholzibacteriia bacterium]